MKFSAGLLLYRKRDDSLEVLLVHPGGPFWAKKDLGVWSIPKGEYEENEDPLVAAYREFEEELGLSPTKQNPLELGSVKLKSGKIVMAWAEESDLDVSTVKSNTFEMEWPPRSGKKQLFPEVDQAVWFTLSIASQKILPAQLPFLDRLAEVLDVDFRTVRQDSLF